MSFVKKKISNKRHSVASDNPKSNDTNSHVPPQAPLLMETKTKQELMKIVPVETSVEESTENSITVTFRMPPGSKGLPVGAFISLHREWVKTTQETDKMLRHIGEITKEHQAEMLRDRQKTKKTDHSKVHHFQMKVVGPLRNKMFELKDNYNKDMGKIFGEKARFAMLNRAQDGYHPYRVRFDPDVVDPAASATMVIQDDGVQRVTFVGLRPNSSYAIQFCVLQLTDRSSDEEIVDMGVLSDPRIVWTLPAEWQMTLEKAGLKRIIRPLEEMEMTSMADWAKISQGDVHSDVITELDLDNADMKTLAAIVSAHGFISKEERDKLAEERKTLEAFVEPFIKQFQQESPNSLQIGDPVRAKTPKTSHPFGVIVNVAPKHLDVKWSFGPDSTKVGKRTPSSLEPTPYSVFLSHAQMEAQNQCGLLSLTMKSAGHPVWYDMDAERLETYHMARGIKNSRVFLLYLTKSYFTRYFCRLEATVAMRLGKKGNNLIVVYETDPRTGYGDPDFIKLAKAATAKYPEFYDWIVASEAIPMARRAYQRHAMMEEISKRIAAAGGKPIFMGADSERVVAGSSNKADTKPARGESGKKLFATAAKVAVSNSQNQAMQRKIDDLQAEVYELRTENANLWTAIDQIKADLRENS